MAHFSFPNLDAELGTFGGTAALSAAVVALLTAAYLTGILGGRKQGGRQIPGPAGWPLIGNALQIPTKGEWIQFDAWGKEYGPIFGLNAAGQKIVILSSPEYIHELMEKRSATTSARWTFRMCGDLVGFRETTVFLNPGPQLRQTRRLIAQTLGRAVTANFDHVIEEENVLLLERLIGSRGGADLGNQIRHAVGATTLRVTYSIRIQDFNDPYIQDAELAMKHFSNTTNPPGKYLVDTFSALQYIPSWFPGAQFKRDAKEWRKDLMRAVNRPFEFVDQELKQNIIRDSFAHEHLSAPGLTEQDAYVIKWAAVSMYLAGSDSTVSGIHTIFRHLALHPEVQKKGRAEIYSVIGQDRLPALKDQDSLPYVTAVMKELFRWHPTVPLGPPHSVEADEVLDGYVIEKGTVLLGNLWSLMHQEKYFNKPFEFIPERFLPEGKAMGLIAELDPVKYFFGYGRRICPGLELAMRQTWLAIARVLATIDVLKPLDEDGNEVDPQSGYIPGAVSHPLNFKCRIVPIDKRTETMIRTAASTIS